MQEKLLNLSLVRRIHSRWPPPDNASLSAKRRRLYMGNLGDGKGTPARIGMQHLTEAIFASLADFERELIRQRTIAGLPSTRVRGRVGAADFGVKAVATEADCYPFRFRNVSNVH